MKLSTLVFSSRFAVLLLAACGTAFFTSCVSVSIGPKKPDSAKNVKYTAPAAPFVPFDSDEIDAGWKNGLKGTSISFKSTCGDVLDLPLENIQQSMLTGIDDLKVTRSEKIPFNQREALNSVIQGKVDGVDTKMEIVILKKNHCTYMISYVGLYKSFDSDLSSFKSFLKGFEAP